MSVYRVGAESRLAGGDGLRRATERRPSELSQLYGSDSSGGGMAARRHRWQRGGSSGGSGGGGTAVVAAAGYLESALGCDDDSFGPTFVHAADRTRSLTV